MREQARNFGLLSGRCFKNIQGGMRGSWINKCGAEGRGMSRRDTSECPQHGARDLGTSTQGCRGVLGPGPSSEACQCSDVRKREVPARGAGGEPGEDQECGVLGTKCRQCFEKQGETNYTKYC